MKSPKSMDYFKELGIDFCCGGNRMLKDVIQEKRLDDDTCKTYEKVYQMMDDMEEYDIR